MIASPPPATTLPRPTDAPARPTARAAFGLVLANGLVAAAALATTAFRPADHQLLAVWCGLALAGLCAALVAQRREAAHARRAAAQLAREQHALLDNPLVGTLRRQGDTVAWCNAALAALLGRPPEALHGLPARDLFPDEATWTAVSRAGEGARRSDGAFRLQVQMRRAGGEPVWVDLSGAPTASDQALWVVVDIDAAKRSEETARALALRDALTGLPNRRLFDEKLADGLAHARRTGHKLAVCLLDLDGFRTLNGLLGQSAGDEVLRQVGARLPGCVRGSDVVARLSGDTFALVLHHVRDPEEAMPVLHRCLDALARPVTLPSSEPLAVRARIGVVLSDGYSDTDTLLGLADQAADDARHAAPSRVHVHGRTAPTT